MKRIPAAWIFLAPAITLILIVGVYPLVRTVVLSLFTQNLSTGLLPEFAGLTNFHRAILDIHFRDAVGRTLAFTGITVALELVLGMVAALAVHHLTFGRSAARTAALVPWVLPTAALGLGWIWIFNDQFGIANALLGAAGILERPVAWLGQPGTAFAALVIADVWKTAPFIMILLLAGLQMIPREQYEAAALDGAGRIRRFWAITLPALRPVIFVAVLFRVMQSFGIFDLVFVMTGGGPGGSTETVALYTYRNLMRYLDFGYGAALLVLSAAVLAVVAGVIWLVLGREKHPS